MEISIVMIVVAVVIGVKFEHKFQLPSRKINDERTMNEYRSDFDILE